MDLVREWLRAACDARVYDGVMCSIIKNEKEDQFYEEVRSVGRFTLNLC